MLNPPINHLEESVGVWQLRVADHLWVVRLVYTLGLYVFTRISYCDALLCAVTIMGRSWEMYTYVHN